MRAEDLNNFLFYVSHLDKAKKKNINLSSYFYFYIAYIHFVCYCKIANNVTTYINNKKKEL